MFAALEFVNKEIAIIPMIWLIGTTKCYWPHAKTEVAFKKLVQNETVPSNKWPTYKVVEVLFTEGK